jgi:fatty-acyl-CoA synthase
MVLSSPAVNNVDWSGWRVVIGGSALPKGLAKMALDKGIDIFGGYGMSETCPVLSLAQPKPSMTELDADTEIAYRTKAGLPIQLVDLRIVDEHMHDVQHDGKTSGEVVVRAPWLTQGYLNDPTNSEELWYGAFLPTTNVKRGSLRAPFGCVFRQSQKCQGEIWYPWVRRLTGQIRTET